MFNVYVREILGYSAVLIGVFSVLFWKTVRNISLILRQNWSYALQKFWLVTACCAMFFFLRRVRFMVWQRKAFTCQNQNSVGKKSSAKKRRKRAQMLRRLWRLLEKGYERKSCQMRLWFYDLWRKKSFICWQLKKSVFSLCLELLPWCKRVEGNVFYFFISECSQEFLKGKFEC